MIFLDRVTPELLELAEHKEWEEGEVYDTYEAGQPWNKGKKGAQKMSPQQYKKHMKMLKERKHDWGHKIGEAQRGRRSNRYPDIDRKGWVKKITMKLNEGMNLAEATRTVGCPENTRHKATSHGSCAGCRYVYKIWKEAA